MITEEQIAMAIAKRMKDHVDREILEKLGVGQPRFTLGKYLGQPGAVRVGYYDGEIHDWFEQQPPGSWRRFKDSTNLCVDYIPDEKLYTMFLLRWTR